MAKKEKFLPREGEQIFADGIKVDCWNQPDQLFNHQVPGKLYLTDQRVFFEASVLVARDTFWEVELGEIAKVKKCLVPPCFPYGVRIVLKNGKKYLLGVYSRGKYVAWLRERLG